MPLNLVSVNLASAALRMIEGRLVPTAINKRPASGRVAVGAMGLQGDEQADPSVHGGLRKAVYAYPAQHYAFWQTVRAQAKAAAWGESLAWGSVGENLTIEGMDETRLWIGDELHLPGCRLIVTEPRQPCFKFNSAMGFEQAAALMQQSGYCGAYLAVLDSGDVGGGDTVTLVPGPRELSLLELFRTKHRRSGT